MASVIFLLYIGHRVLLALKLILSAADECSYLLTVGVFSIIEFDDASLRNPELYSTHS